MTATERAIEVARLAARAAEDKLATDVVIIDVSDRLAITDCFVVASASNERQVGAIVDEVEGRLAAAGVKAVRREGERDGRWVLLDFLDVVVHVQHAEERVFYALDRLWRDCPVIPVDAAQTASGATSGSDVAGESEAGEPEAAGAIPNATGEPDTAGAKPNATGESDAAGPGHDA